MFKQLSFYKKKKKNCNNVKSNFGARRVSFITQLNKQTLKLSTEQSVLPFLVPLLAASWTVSPGTGVQPAVASPGKGESPSP